MKTVIINGQNHKGSTYNIGVKLAKNNPDDPESKHWRDQGWLDGKRPWN